MSQDENTAMQAYRPEPLRWREISDLRGYLKGNTLFPSQTLMTPKEAKRTDDALAELARAEIVEKNLARMSSEEEGGMEFVLSRESMGGNAGHFEELPCGGANFRYDGRTGLILYFGNSQDVPREIQKFSAEGIFRVPVDMRSLLPVGISDSYLHGNPSEDAKKALRESVTEYNKRSGGRIKNPTFDVVSGRGR